MCGIVGVWNYKSKAPVNRELFERMTSTLIHRGPDDCGSYFDDSAGLALGFRRLAIIDLSPAGHQPMANEDGSVWLVFNGEIYNFLDLRPKLEARGHAFRSRTDSEVILHQYEERGVECVRDLNGMFGLALWDARQPRLVLARDRVGKKPLYYLDDGQRLVFTSELKAILADPSVGRTVDQAALMEYMALGYVAAPRTIFQGIRKLPPAHTLECQDGRVSIQRYWDWQPAFRRVKEQSEAAWGAELLDCLRGAVRDRLMSDVPLGAFLSGGVDSSAVVGMMVDLSSAPVKTFSIGFEGSLVNELPYARAVAERFGTDHHELYVQPDSVRDFVPRLVHSFDEPFADSSAIPTYYVAQMTRRYVTVALSGDGGDEALAGYHRYPRMLAESRLDWVPASLRRAVLKWPAQWLPAGRPGRRLAQRLSYPLDERYALSMSAIVHDDIGRLLRPGLANGGRCSGRQIVAAAVRAAPGLDALSRLQYADMLTYLPEDILVKVDRMSMANSLEVRSPLLDYRFLELAAAVPANLRLHGGQGKQVFKRALRGWLPDEALDRTKAGFIFPLRDWFRAGLADFADEVFQDPSTRANGFLQPAEVLRLTQAHRQGRRNHENVLWSALVLEMWRRSIFAVG
jgi:asparagine synthase (glutamine-hydrolysing)